MRETGYIKGVASPIVLWSIGNGHMLRMDAAAYFLAMRQAAKDSAIDLVVNSSFRSMAKQEALYAQYQKDLTAFIKKERATKPSLVARPGFSNHQGGVAVDINRAPGDDLKTPQPDSPIDLWLNTNASGFGFGRTVASEPWHWEYLHGA